MDIQTLFKIQCGLFVAGVESEGKINACICNTMMQQSHEPIRISVTLDKTHLTHDMVLAKKSFTMCPLEENVDADIIRRFGFASGRDKDKFADFPCETDVNGNPLLPEQYASATFSLKVYDTVDMITHTLFLCSIDDMQSYDKNSLTYSGYRARKKS